MSKENILAIIPARGGSKGVPKKSIAPLNGKPLLSYTCESAKKAKLIDRLIISTDDQEMADVAKSYGAEAPFLQPAEISTDSSPAIEVVLHALKWFHDNEQYIPDAIIYLQPTSPFRTASHIDEAITKFKNDPEADTLVSVSEIEHRFLPMKLMKLNDDYLEPYEKGKGVVVLTRHNLPTLYARNGPSILIMSTQSVLTTKKLYGQKILPYIMPDFIQSIDIDKNEDLKLAEKLIKE